MGQWKNLLGTKEIKEIQSQKGDKDDQQPKLQHHCTKSWFLETSTPLQKALPKEGSSTNVLYWDTFIGLNISKDLLQSHSGFLIGFEGHVIVTFLDAILSKTLCGTLALLAGRGCGKSATLGLSIAGAIVVGYSNVFLTAPSPDNLKTLFEFILKGFEALHYKVQVLSLIDIYNNYCLNKIHLEMYVKPEL
ncbi:hypothetical protein JHK85_019216 [Glycine max]|nr:hypothetical protein JHK85_019216 [Glycine max]